MSTMQYDSSHYTSVLNSHNTHYRYYLNFRFKTQRR